MTPSVLVEAFKGNDPPPVPDAPQVVNVAIRSPSTSSFQIYENGKKVLEGPGTIPVTPGKPRSLAVRANGFKPTTIYLDGKVTNFAIRLEKLPTVTPGSQCSQGSGTVKPPVDPGCKGIMARPLDPACRAQFCAIASHKDDPRCLVE